MDYASDRPLRCRIRVRGVPEPSWLGELAGLTVIESDSQDRTTVLLAGDLADQPALVGLINALYSFGFTIEAIHCCIIRDP